MYHDCHFQNRPMSSGNLYRNLTICIFSRLPVKKIIVLIRAAIMLIAALFFPLLTNYPFQAPEIKNRFC